MQREFSRKKLAAIFITTIIIVLIAWFSWMSMVTAKTRFMETKVQEGLTAGIQVVERDAPRIKITNDGGYFVPDVKGNLPSNVPVNSSWQEAYKTLLVNLNQNTTIPLAKVSNVSLDSDYQKVIDAHATVKFEVLFGITKTINVSTSMPLPHFKNPTGTVRIS